MTITKQEADTVYALARALEDTGRLCSLAESDDKLEWRKKNQETQCALQDVLKQLQEPESEPTAIEALTLALETERDAANLYAKQVAHWIGKHDAIKAQYEDLINQVSRKFPGESRHETAKRYICNWEGRDADSVAKQEVKG